MTLEERAQKASELKATGECNCTQAVLKVFEDIIPSDDRTLMTIGSGFAAGMGCMESTCGALVGAVMTAGFITEGQGTPRHSKEILKIFKEACGDTICKNLKGVETGKMLCACPDCVYNAVMALGKAGLVK